MTDGGRGVRSIGALMMATAIGGGLTAMPAFAQNSGQSPATQNDGAEQLGPLKVHGEGSVAPGANPYADPEAAYKVDRLSSSKFAEPVLNTPRTTTVLTKEALEDKDATTLREIARSTAGVTLGSGEGGNAF